MYFDQILESMQGIFVGHIAHILFEIRGEIRLQTDFWREETLGAINISCLVSHQCSASTAAQWGTRIGIFLGEG